MLVMKHATGILTAIAMVTTVQVEPYGCMMRKDDAGFKELVDGTITRLMDSGEFAKLYAKWFESPIPPKDVNLSMPMSVLWQLKS